MCFFFFFILSPIKQTEMRQWQSMHPINILVYRIYFLNRPNDGSLSLSDEMNVDFAEIMNIYSCIKRKWR